MINLGEVVTAEWRDGTGVPHKTNGKLLEIRKSSFGESYIILPEGFLSLPIQVEIIHRKEDYNKEKLEFKALPPPPSDRNSGETFRNI